MDKTITRDEDKMENLEERLIGLAMVFKRSEKVKTKEHEIYYEITKYLIKREYTTEEIQKMSIKEFITLEHDIYYNLLELYCNDQNYQT